MEPLKSCTGGSAEGENRFFKRAKIIQKIRRKLANGEHLLISAPRRIGKTSILKHIRDTPEQNQIIKYLIVQSVESIEEFNKRLLDELIKDQQIFNGLDGFKQRAGATVKKHLSRVKTISQKGVELNKDVTIDYYAELNELFDELKNHDKQIIVFIDEFPDAVTNIDKSDRRNAIKLLQQQREIREKYKNSQIQLVYTGSTGLKNVVKKLGDIHLVNNLVEIKVPPLRLPEAREFMQRLVLGKQQELDTFDVSDEVIAYTLKKIQWFLPYYIQIIVEELFDQHEEDESYPPPPITIETIDTLFKALIKSNSAHGDYFDHWKIRLKGFEKRERQLAIEVLNLTADQGTISYEQYHDLAVKHAVIERQHVLEVLQNDGYLSGDENDQHYGFNSILLKEWWVNNVTR